MRNSGIDTLRQMAVLFLLPLTICLQGVQNKYFHTNPMRGPVSQPENISIKTALDNIEYSFDSAIICSVTGKTGAFPSANRTLNDSTETEICVVEEMPEFPGGNKAMFEFIKDNLIYPVKALENKIEGKVIVSFIVAEDGKLNDIKTFKGIGYGCDDEAERVITLMPKWKPGTAAGKVAKIKLSIPIVFKLR